MPPKTDAISDVLTSLIEFAQGKSYSIAEATRIHMKLEELGRIIRENTEEP
jgi:predicted CopG family antitoxin